LTLRDFTAVMLHEMAHVAWRRPRSERHLMAPVYDRSNGHCIDRGAVAMVASAQRLPLGQLKLVRRTGSRQPLIPSRTDRALNPEGRHHVLAEAVHRGHVLWRGPWAPKPVWQSKCLNAASRSSATCSRTREGVP